MSMTLENLRKELIALPYEQRRDILDELCDSIIRDEAGDRDVDTDSDPELNAMLLQRIEDFESGRAKAIPIEEAIADLRRAYP